QQKVRSTGKSKRVATWKPAAIPPDICGGDAASARQSLLRSLSACTPRPQSACARRSQAAATISASPSVVASAAISAGSTQRASAHDQVACRAHGAATRPQSGLLPCDSAAGAAAPAAPTTLLPDAGVGAGLFPTAACEIRLPSAADPSYPRRVRDSAAPGHLE